MEGKIESTHRFHFFHDASLLRALLSQKGGEEAFLPNLRQVKLYHLQLKQTEEMSQMN